jgi:hypothetical protein
LHQESTVNAVEHVLASLVKEAPELTVEVREHRRKLDMIAAWQRKVPLLRAKSDANCLAWLSSYTADIYGKTLSTAAGPTRQDYQAGGAGAFNKAVDTVLKIARAHKLAPQGAMASVAFLPIKTSNSLTCIVDKDGESCRLTVFQLGLHEFLDGLTRIVLATESAYPLDAFVGFDPCDPAWKNRYRELISGCLDKHPAFEEALALLLLRTLFLGHPGGVQRYPFGESVELMHEIVFRHVELFLIAHELGHAMQDSGSPGSGGMSSLRIGDSSVLVPARSPENEAFADVIGFTVADIGLDETAEKFDGFKEYALVGPDFCLSMLAFLEDILGALGARRAGADQHAPARARRQQRRDFLVAYRSEKTLVLGERFELVLETLYPRVVGRLQEPIKNGRALHAAWCETI